MGLSYALQAIPDVVEDDLYSLDVVRDANFLENQQCQLREMAQS
jgi:hypothetical protein